VTSGTLPYPPIAVRPTTTVTQPSALGRGHFHGVAIVVGDVLGITAILCCIPFVIVAVAMPLVLSIRLLIWLAALP
jgi:hypothetical protein